MDNQSNDNDIVTTQSDTNPIAVQMGLTNEQFEVHRLDKSMEYINGCLNKAAKAGVYNMDESHMAKTALINVQKFINDYLKTKKI